MWMYILAGVGAVLLFIVALLLIMCILDLPYIKMRRCRNCKHQYKPCIDVSCCSRGIKASNYPIDNCPEFRRKNFIYSNWISLVMLVLNWRNLDY